MLASNGIVVSMLKHLWNLGGPGHPMGCRDPTEVGGFAGKSSGGAFGVVSSNCGNFAVEMIDTGTNFGAISSCCVGFVKVRWLA